MKRPNLFCRILCCFFSVYLALPVSVLAQTPFSLNPPQFPDTNTVRLALQDAATNVVFTIYQSSVMSNGVTLTPVATGSVGQLTFDLTKPTDNAVFYRASYLVPPETLQVATPVLTPDGGSYTWPTNVVITCATDGAGIYFTTNGSDPTTLDNHIYNGGSVLLACVTTLKVRAFKSSYTDSAVAGATYTINSGPVVSAGPQQIIAGSNTTLQGYVTDDGLTGGGTRWTNWSKISGPGTVTFGNASQTNSTATLSADGIYVLQLAASDGQYTNTSQVTIARNPTLFVTLDSPANNASFIVPTNLLLRATASSTSGSVTQLLLYAGQTFIGKASNDASGFNYEWRSVPVGTHALKAVAYSSDANNLSLASTNPVTITVDWPTNVGQVTLALTDLQIPVAGLPIAINRLYNSRYGTNGAFGYNWRLDWEGVRIEKSGSLASGWTGKRSGGITYFFAENTTHTVTVALGENEKYYFRPVLVFTPGDTPSVNSASVPNWENGYRGRTIFQPVGGSLGSLSANDSGLEIGYDDGLLGWNNVIVTPVILEDDGFGDLAPVANYDPDLSALTFTGPDGMQYQFDSAGNLIRRIDRNGNSLDYSYSSLYHSSGTQVTFTRDGGNRITDIYDPIAQQISGSPALKYGYDSNGNLTNMARLIQRSPAAYENTRYAYTNASFPYHITSITDPRGIIAQRYEYDTSGRLLRQYDALNRFTTYSYDLSGHRQTVTDRLTNSTTQNFTASGQLANVQDAAGGVTSYGYDDRGRRTAEVNALGQGTAYTYDGRDQLTGTTNEMGAATSATYNDFGQVLVSIDARGYGTTNGYDVTGNLIAGTNALGTVSLYGYDAQGNRLAETNAFGRPEQVIVLNNYNEFGWLTNTTTFNAQLSTLSQASYTYDANGNRLTESKPRTLPGGGQEILLTQWTYDAVNRVITTIDAGGFTNGVVYNGINKQSQTIDALNRTNQFFYDPVGLLTNTTYADGLLERFYYDAEGRRTQSVNRGGRTNIFTYDALSRLLRTTYADGAYTESAYDLAGRLKSTVQWPPPHGTPPSVSPDPITTATYDYDAAGRRVALKDALGQTTRWAYDASGNQTNLVDALGRTNRYDYDALNRQTKIAYPDGTSESYGYDGLDRRIAVTNQATIVTRFGFDALGRLSTVTNAFGTTQAMTTRYEYDEAGNLLRQMDALNRTNKFEYDALGRRTKETMPAGQSATFGYDAVGNPTWRTNFNGVAITNLYDAVNRLTNKASAGGYQIRFAYNPTGQRTNMVDASGANSYTYDRRDRLLTKATPQGTLTYTYDYFGNLASIQSSTANGTWIGYTYDLLNRVADVTDGFNNTTTYGFDAVGSLQTVCYPNAVTNTWSYNALNRLTNISVTTASGTIASFAYELGAAGNRTNLVENLNGLWRTNRWGYDPLYRLTNEVIADSAPTGTISYKYDGVGNRTNRTSTVSGVGNQTNSFNSNDQLSGDVYDSNGNTRTNGSNAFFYDAENRLTNAIVGGTNILILYDGDGNRVKKVVGTTTNYFLIDDRNPTGYAQVLEELTTVGSTPDRLYIYGLDLISQRQSDGTTSFYGYDGNGNVRFLTATNATISDTYVYDAFGIVITNTGTTPNSYRYTGEQYDPNLGFYFLRARYMNPNSGRFLTHDSFEGDSFDPPSLHKYLYAGNDPVNHTDPSGKGELAEVLTAILVVSILVNATFLVIDSHKLFKARTYEERAYYSTLVALDGVGLLMGIWGGGIGPSLSRATVGGGTRIVARAAVEQAIAGSASIAATHLVVSASSTSEVLGKSYDQLVKDAEKDYPKKVGKPDEDHHLIPKYVGGDPKGPTVNLPAPYHQYITSEFRRQYGYGQGAPQPDELKRILEEVYKKYPLPPNP